MADKTLLLEKTTQTLIGTQDFRDLAEKSVKLIVNELTTEGLTAAAIFRHKPEEKALQAYAYASKNQKTIDKMLPKKFFELTTPMSNQENLAVKSILGNTIEQSPNLADFSAGVLPRTATDGIQMVMGAKFCISFPIVSKIGKPVGAILYILENEQATPKQLELFQTYAGQLGLAFSNVFAFEKLMEKYKRDVAMLEADTDKDEVPSIKFTLRITPNENRKLEEMASSKKKTKAEIIRDLIDNSK